MWARRSRFLSPGDMECILTSAACFSCGRHIATLPGLFFPVDMLFLDKISVFTETSRSTKHGQPEASLRTGSNQRVDDLP
jgi:hypothetical protein